jgi:curved DNA-binding protein CbpA
MNQPVDNRNYYEILHVAYDAPLERIRESYRKLMQKDGHHPDLGGDARTAALINKAYAVLSDRDHRAKYDRHLAIVAHSLRATRGPSQKPVRVINPARVCVFCEVPHFHGQVRDADVHCDNCNSPLNPAGNIRMEPADQRAVARVTKELGVTFFTDWRQKNGFAGRTEDISPSGLRLVSKRRIEPDQRIRIVSSIVEAVGTITHCAPRRSGWKTVHVAGVSFLTLRFIQSVGGFVSRRV